MKTADEARECWCPFARTMETWEDSRGVVAAASINREAGDYDKQGNETVTIYGRHRCIASRCMAWQWTTTPEAAAFRAQTPDIWQDDPRDMLATGFCGLAGGRP